MLSCSDCHFLHTPVVPNCITSLCITYTCCAIVRAHGFEHCAFHSMPFLPCTWSQAEPAPKGYCDPRALSPAGPAELGEQGAREVVEAPATPDRDW
jgi:hypothetical protein